MGPTYPAAMALRKQYINSDNPDDNGIGVEDQYPQVPPAQVAQNLQIAQQDWPAPAALPSAAAYPPYKTPAGLQGDTVWQESPASVRGRVLDLMSRQADQKEQQDRQDEMYQAQLAEAQLKANPRTVLPEGAAISQGGAVTATNPKAFAPTVLKPQEQAFQNGQSVGENANQPTTVIPMGASAVRGDEIIGTGNMGGASAGATAGGGAAPSPGAKDEGFLSSLDPGIATQVKMLAEGKLNVPAFALRTPYWQQLLQLTAQYDPSFDTVNYNSRSKTRNDFTSGKSAQTINAINTAIGHLSQLGTAADQLGNSGVQPFNTAKNFVKTQLGSPDVTNFQNIVVPVADELTRVWRQAGGSEQDIQSRLKNLSSSNSPEQLKGAIQQIGGLLKSKLDSLGEQYGQGMGTDPIDVVSPEAKQILGRLTGNVPRGTSRAPSGATHIARGSDGQRHYTNSSGQDLGVAP